MKKLVKVIKAWLDWFYFVTGYSFLFSGFGIVIWYRLQSIHNAKTEEWVISVPLVFCFIGLLMLWFRNFVTKPGEEFWNYWEKKESGAKHE